MVEEREPRKRSPAAGQPKRFTDGQWDDLVAAFREHPGETGLVSEITGIKRARVVRAWHHGYPNQQRLPISQTIDAEKVLARTKRAELMAEEPEVKKSAETRAKVKVDSPPVHSSGPDEDPPVEIVSADHKRVMAALRQRDEQRRKALEDSARTRAEEGRLIIISRRNVMQLGVAAAKILRGAEQLATRIETQLNKATDIPLKDAMNMVQKASVIVRLGTEAGKMAVQMERLAMGQPIGDGSDVASTGKLSPDDAERWIHMTLRALEASKRRRADLDDDDEAESGTDPETAPERQLPSDADDVVHVGRRASDFN